MTADRLSFVVRQKYSGKTVTVPRSLVNREPRIRSVRPKQALDQAAPCRRPHSAKIDHVERNISEAKANGGAHFQLRSRVPQLVCGWAGPKFRNKKPYWARDKYIPSRWQGLQWDEKANNGKGAYQAWDKEHKEYAKVNGKEVLIKRGGYVKNGPELPNFDLEDAPPRNSRGNLNFGDALWGKMPHYKHSENNENVLESQKIVPSGVSETKGNNKKLQGLRDQLQTLNKNYCKVQGAMNGPKAKLRLQIEAQLRDVERNISRVMGRPPPREGFLS